MPLRLQTEDINFWESRVFVYDRTFYKKTKIFDFLNFHNFKENFGPYDFDILYLIHLRRLVFHKIKSRVVKGLLARVPLRNVITLRLGLLRIFLRLFQYLQKEIFRNSKLSLNTKAIRFENRTFMLLSILRI